MTYATSEQLVPDSAHVDVRLHELPAAVAEVDQHAVISYANRRFCELIGAEAAQLVGRPLRSFIDFELPIEGDRGDEWVTSRRGMAANSPAPKPNDRRDLLRVEWVRSVDRVLIVLTRPERIAQRSFVQALRAVRAAERLLRAASKAAREDVSPSSQRTSDYESVPPSAEQANAWGTGDGISQREAEILRAMLGGRSVVQVANALRLSVHTVRNHLKSIYRKLGVHSREELFASFLSHNQGLDGDLEHAGALDASVD